MLLVRGIRNLLLQGPIFTEELLGATGPTVQVYGSLRKATAAVEAPSEVSRTQTELDQEGLGTVVSSLPVPLFPILA